ncbi:MAG TPA: hypothetical protein VIP46_05825 [Pyrinomonadaceae bacterium]
MEISDLFANLPLLVLVGVAAIVLLVILTRLFVNVGAREIAI